MSARKKFIIGDSGQDKELEDALYDVITGEDSDLDYDFGDEDIADDPAYVPEITEEDDEEDEEENEEEDNSLSTMVRSHQSTSSHVPSTASTSERRVFWKSSDNFDPLPPAPRFELPNTVAINLPPHDYVAKYLTSDIYEQNAFHSNQTYLSKTGTNLNTSDKEIRTFFGVTIMMSYLRFPRIRMYWDQKSRIPAIADRITRDRYFKLRASLKLLNDSEIPEEIKSSTKFWKVQLLISCVRNGCLLNSPSADVCIDEQMIPFYGKHQARQMIKGKLNPVGLKNFVLACPKGLPLDFFLYEGKGDSVIEDDRFQSLDIGGKVIMRLSARLPPGCSIFMGDFGEKLL
ncbi:piggyBac transposable element-derived protein 3-like [Battus philenor]|uniref:piggyBac transposable element-derived protein 3-like n=1 Tax=Battus philenor TaxID=42288 RepID=UPI0035CEC3DE